MATEFASQIGSGNQPFRKEFHGKHHRPGLGVNILNWEDSNPVYQIRASGFDVDSTAGGTLLPPGGSLPTRRVIAVYNNDSTNAVYVGESGITETNGYPVAAGTEKAFAIAANLDLYAIAGAGNTVNVRIMEIA
jgi:hypothetical protein